MSKIELMTKELTDKDSMLNNLQNQNKTYESQLKELNDNNSRLFKSLQTQEALTKVIYFKN